MSSPALQPNGSNVKVLMHNDTTNNSIKGLRLIVYNSQVGV